MILLFSLVSLIIFIFFLYFPHHLFSTYFFFFVSLPSSALLTTKPSWRVSFVRKAISLRSVFQIWLSLAQLKQCMLPQRVQGIPRGCGGAGIVRLCTLILPLPLSPCVELALGKWKAHVWRRVEALTVACFAMLLPSGHSDGGCPLSLSPGRRMTLSRGHSWPASGTQHNQETNPFCFMPLRFSGCLLLQRNAAIFNRWIFLGNRKKN